MKTTTLFLASLVMMVFASCSGLRSVKVERQTAFKDKNGNLEPTLFWSHYDASQRASLFKMDANGKLSVISENPPDVAVERSLDIIAKANASGKLDAEASVKAVQSVAQLGQRTAAVNILRDALYRLAEMCNNSDAGMNSPMNADVKEVMLKTLETCEKVSIEMAKETDATKKAEMTKDLKEMFLSLPVEQRNALDFGAALNAL